jgi:hypothetical protein
VTTVLTAVALGAFILAALTALLATALRDYDDVADVRSLRLMTDDAHWWATPAAARQDLAAVDVTKVDTLRDGNEKKASRLTLAASFQLIAIEPPGRRLKRHVSRPAAGPAFRITCVQGRPFCGLAATVVCAEWASCGPTSLLVDCSMARQRPRRPRAIATLTRLTEASRRLRHVVTGDQTAVSRPTATSGRLPTGPRRGKGACCREQGFGETMAVQHLGQRELRVTDQLEIRVGDVVQDIAQDLDEDIYVLAPQEQSYLLLEAALAAVAGFLLQAFLEGIKTVIADASADGIRVGYKRIMQSLRKRLAGTLDRPHSMVDADANEVRLNVSNDLRELERHRTTSQLESLTAKVQLDFQGALIDEGLSEGAAVAIAKKLGAATTRLLAVPDDTSA